MKHIAASQPEFPRNRAFKVQLHASTTADQIHGQVENMRSGEVRTFDSIEALYAAFADSDGTASR